MVETLRYKLEGNEFDSRRCYWNVSLTYFFRSHCGSRVDSASNRNVYQEYFLGGKGGRCVGLTTLPPTCADCFEMGAWTSWNPQDLSRHYFTLRRRKTYLPLHIYENRSMLSFILLSSGIRSHLAAHIRVNVSEEIFVSIFMADCYCNEMEILSFIIILICIEFRHSPNSDCSSSWLAQLSFAVPYTAGLITRATPELRHGKEFITL